MKFRIYQSDKKFSGFCGRLNCTAVADYLIVIDKFRDNKEYESMKAKYMIQSFTGHYSGASFVLDFELSLCKACYQKFLKELDVFDMI